MKRLLPLLLCILFLSVGCLNLEEEEPDITPIPTAAPTPSATPTPIVAQDGGTLHLSMRAPKTLNPLLNEDITVDRVLKLVFEPLTILDDRLQPSEHVASLNFSSDYSSVTVTLRDDAIWSDGMPVTASDVIFSVDFLRKAPEAAIYKHCIDNIAYCEPISTKSLKITFVEMFGGSGYALNFPVIPQHYYKDETNPSSTKNMNPLGNGLFLFESYTPMKGMMLNKSPYSFRKRAYIENVEVLVMPDIDTDIDAFEQGLIDVLPLEVTEWSKQHGVKETRYGEYAAMYFEFIGFNFNNEIVKDITFRQALAHALNTEELISSIFVGHAVRSLSPVNPASWLYDTDVAVYEYDEEKAKAKIKTMAAESLDEWPVFHILVNEENDERVKIAKAIADQMTLLDLETELEILPFESYMERLTAGQFDLFVGGYNLSVTPDLSFAFHSNAIQSGSNLLSYSDSEMDRLLDVTFLTSNEALYQQALSNVQRHIAEQLPVISLVFRKSAILTDVRINGELKPSVDNILANVNEWFIAVTE